MSGAKNPLAVLTKRLSEKKRAASSSLTNRDSIAGMKRKRAAPVFKPYVMNQVALMPSSYEEKIPVDHLGRVVNEAVEISI